MLGMKRNVIFVLVKVKKGECMDNAMKVEADLDQE